MKPVKNIFFIITALFISPGVFAQRDSTQSTDNAQLKLGVYYNSHLNYYGRTDSFHSSGFFPLAELWFTKNIYINAAPVFVNNKTQNFKYAGTIATAGLQFRNENKFAGHFYVVKPFYQSHSELVQSALKWQAAVNLTWLNEFINFTAGGDLKFSDKTDYGATAGLDHIFREQLNSHTVLVVNPSAYAYAGTQQFTKTYLSKSAGFLLFPGSEQLVTESARKFSILSYELSVPVILGINKCQFLLTPAYTLPQNLITVENRPDLSERGKEMLYITLGAKIIL
ncbi:MAG: hypothetical protein JWM28_2407 [Chitinophagaceae bacterium]|nr:hypothetical protein [Chitinophagaceae bacterium]